MSRPSTWHSEFCLAFETSSPWGSVALGRGPELIDARRFSAPMRHAVEFLGTVEAMCRTYDVSPLAVSRVYVSSGPGSFTGLRIGITAARMIAFARRVASGEDVHLVAVPTLSVIAHNALHSIDPPRHVAVILDAKRSRVYAARFVRNGDTYVAEREPAEVEPVAFLAGQTRDTAIIGEGVHQHRAAVEESGLPILPESLYAPGAETVFELGITLAGAGQFVEPRQLIPTYIRAPEAEEKWSRKHGGTMA